MPDLGAGDDRGLPCELIAHDFLPAFNGTAQHHRVAVGHADVPLLDQDARHLVDVAAGDVPIGAIICASATGSRLNSAILWIR